MRKKVITRCIIGFICGIVVGTIISLLSSSFTLISSPAVNNVCGNVLGFIIQAILTGLIGVAGIGGMSFYDSDLLDSWGLHAVTFVHYLCVISAFVVSAIILDWGTALDIFIMTLIETAVFFAIWLTLYLSWRKEVREMNESLKKYKDENMTNNN